MARDKGATTSCGYAVQDFRRRLQQLAMGYNRIIIVAMGYNRIYNTINNSDYVQCALLTVAQWAGLEIAQRL